MGTAFIHLDSPLDPYREFFPLGVYLDPEEIH